jgi:GAF domain-containing protein
MNQWMDIRDREPERWETFTRQCLVLLDTARRLDGTDKGNIQLFNPVYQGLQIIVQRGFALPFLQQFEVVRIDEPSACGRAFRHGQRVMISDINNDVLYMPYRSIAKASGYQAVQSTPLAGKDGSIIGVLSTHGAEPHKWECASLQGLDLCAVELSRLILALNKSNIPRTLDTPSQHGDR